MGAVPQGSGFDPLAAVASGIPIQVIAGGVDDLYLSYQGLLAHLGTPTRNELRFHGTPATVPVLTDPTSRQKQAFDLIRTAVPLTLKK